jgi:hypothetical protein
MRDTLRMTAILLAAFVLVAGAFTLLGPHQASFVPHPSVAASR